jgi:small multidrug resistance pump
MSYFLLISSGIMSALASVLLRIAGQMPEASAATVAVLTSTPMLLRLGAIVAYGLGFILYALALRRIELSVAYPLMVGVAILAIFLYGLAGGDAVTLKSVIGAILIFSGILLLYSKNLA